MDGKNEVCDNSVTFRLTREERERLDGYAKKCGLSRTAIFRERLSTILSGAIEAAPAGAGQAIQTR